MWGRPAWQKFQQGGFPADSSGDLWADIRRMLTAYERVKEKAKRGMYIPISLPTVIFMDETLILRAGECFTHVIPIFNLTR
jgi:hypothetical protein